MGLSHKSTSGADQIHLSFSPLKNNHIDYEFKYKPRAKNNACSVNHTKKCKALWLFKKGLHTSILWKKALELRKDLKKEQYSNQTQS